MKLPAPLAFSYLLLAVGSPGGQAAEQQAYCSFPASFAIDVGLPGMKKTGVVCLVFQNIYCLLSHSK